MILIREEIAESAVRVAQGKDAEFISVKLNQYQPPIVITQYYGSTPRAGVGFPELSEEIFELFSVIRKYQRQGVLSLVTGDINAWTGRDMIRNNHFSVNKEGILWKELVRESDMVFVNDRLSNPITFVDKRTGRGRNSLHSFPHKLDGVLSRLSPNVCNIKFLLVLRRKRRHGELLMPFY